LWQDVVAERPLIFLAKFCDSVVLKSSEAIDHGLLGKGCDVHSGGKPESGKVGVLIVARQFYYA
jgi:hypothetical protein